MDCLHHHPYHYGGHVCIASSEYGSRPLTNISGYASVRLTRCDSHARGSTFRTLCRSNVRGLFLSLIYTLLLYASYIILVMSWWLTYQQSYGTSLQWYLSTTNVELSVCILHPRGWPKSGYWRTSDHSRVIQWCNTHITVVQPRMRLPPQEHGNFSCVAEIHFVCT